MDRKWKGKGVPIFIGAVLGVLIALILMSAGVARAGIRVQNRADLVYYTSVNQVVSYTNFNTCDLVVLFGPRMFLEKWIMNEATRETNTTMVHVSRGESITIHLESENSGANADTDAWHVTIVDIVNTLTQMVGGTATVGPNSGTSGVVHDSFTYIAGTETATNANSYTVPDSIQYYVYGQGWSNWQAYGSKNETTVWPNGPGGSNNISGFRWYWRNIPSANKWDDSPGLGGNTPNAGARYKINTTFSLQRNDN